MEQSKQNGSPAEWSIARLRPLQNQFLAAWEAKCR
jgi:hypothetical protein